MKRLLPFLLLLFTLPAFAATWTFEHAKVFTCTASVSPCTGTLTTGVAGGNNDVAVIWTYTVNATTVTISSATLGSASATLVPSSGCSAADNAPHNTDCAYFINPTASATALSVSVSPTPSATYYVAYAEYTTSASNAFYDTAGSAFNDTSGLSQVGPTLTLGGTNDVILQGMRAGSAPTAYSGGYAAVSGIANGNTYAVATLANTSSGTALTWTTASAKSAMNAIAFRDTSPTGLTQPSCTPGSGPVPQTVTCTIVGGATGCYTTSGTPPTAPVAGTCGSGSTTYSTAITISTIGENLQILATELLNTNSAVTSYTYGTTVAFTAVATGDWQSTTTWGTSGSGCHIAYPCMTDSGSQGDTVTMPDGLTVTCGTGETCSVGNSPSTNAVVMTQSHTTGAGGFVVGTGATFIYAGSVTLYTGSFTLDAGSTVQYDSSWSTASTTAAYYFLTHNTSYSPVTWTVSGTSGSHVTWQGDSYSSPQKDSGICAQYACEAGSIGYIGTSSIQADIGYGTYSYFDVDNIGGSSYGSGTLGWLISVSSPSAYGNVTLSNVNVSGSGPMRVMVQSSNAAGSIAITSIAFTNCTDTRAVDGCFIYGPYASGDTGAGTYTVTGLTADGYINVAVGAEASPWVLRDVFLWAGTAGGNPGQEAGFDNTNGATYDQVFVDHDTWYLGTTDTEINTYEPSNLSNSVFWDEHVANDHHHFILQDYGEVGSSGGPYYISNSVFGALGTTTTQQISAWTGFGSPATLSTYFYNGDVALCGYGGTGTVMMPGAYLNQTTLNLSITESKNTYCNTSNPGGNQPSQGAAGFESITIPSATIASIDSNLEFCDVVGGCAISTVQSPADSSASTTAITFEGTNAAINASSYVQQYSGNNFVQTFGTDTAISGRLPALVEPTRSVPLFDTEYLFQEGLLTLASYSVVGAWTSGTNYTVGQVVSFSNSSVFNGRTTYWRCIVAHTAGSTNEPVLGVDAANPYQEATGFWEEAYLSWIRTNVLANNTFDTQCAALLFVACPSPHTYAPGLLAAWLRQGFVSMEPWLWNTGTSGVEIGAVALKPIQHLPPSAGVN